MTDKNTPNIDGVTDTIRNDLPKEIMLARLEAYKNFPFNGKHTFFCDADSLFINKLDLSKLNFHLYLSIRKKIVMFTLKDIQNSKIRLLKM